MKRLLALILAGVVSVGAAAVAQSGKGSGDDKPAPAASLKTIKGRVKSDGGKVTFVSDKDKKSWDVMNPEALKGHEGHHVEVKAHVYEDKSAIRVMEVKMAPSSSEDSGNNPETRY